MRRVIFFSNVYKIKWTIFYYKYNIRCGETFVESLFVEYDFQDRSRERGKILTGSNIRLVRCSGNKCSGGKAQAQVADKYVEYEMILVLIDVILHRIPAFRHLLFNRYPPSSMKVCLVMKCFDFYLIFKIVFSFRNQLKLFFQYALF